MARIRLNVIRLSVTEKLAKGDNRYRDDKQHEFRESEPVVKLLAMNACP